MKEAYISKLADIVFHVVFSNVTAFLLLAAIVLLLLWRLYLRLRSWALEQVEYERSFSADGVFCGTELTMTESMKLTRPIRTDSAVAGHATFMNVL